MRTDDWSLLCQYARRHSDEAFATLVNRHLNMVYSVALRQLRSPHFAQEVAQSVFSDLARNAGTLKPDTVLAAWLYRVAYRTAVDVVRHESRRHAREQIAMEMAAMNTASSEWMRIEPLLDEAMEVLDEQDRMAILLRYFDNKSLREVGDALGISEDAAQKRVSRAVDQLRELFSKRGVIVGTGGLAVVISANAVQAAPAGVAVAISAAAALAGTTTVATTTATVTKAIVMTTLQKTLITVTIGAAVGAGIYEAHQASTLRTQVHSLQQQETTSAEQIKRLGRERDEAIARRAMLQQENEQLRATVTEIANLRAEVERLQATQPQPKTEMDPNDSSAQRIEELRAKAQQIKGLLQQMPDKQIPELKLLTDDDWLMAAKKAKFDTDTDVRKALSNLRSLAKHHLPLGRALFAYVRVNNDQLPSDPSQLKASLRSALDQTTVLGEALDDATLDAILGRYKLLHTGNLSDFPPGGYILVEKASVDKDYDTRFKFGDGSSSTIDTGIEAKGDPEDPSY